MGFKLVGTEEGTLNKSVVIGLSKWEIVVSNLLVEFETSRDIVNNYRGEDEEEEIGFHIKYREETKKIIRDIQIQVGHEWVQFIDTSLWDRDLESEVEIDNRDSTTTELHVEGLTFELTLDQLNEYLKGDPKELDNVGVEIVHGLITLVLYLEDIKYLIENMSGNSESE